MKGLILRATPPFSDFSVKINYYFQIDNGCLIWEIINPSASNIFLFYLRHFHPRPTHIPLNSPSATGFSDLYGGVCKRGAGVWGGGGCWAQIMSIYTAISGKVVGKYVHSIILKDNMGYDQYTVPDTVAFEPTFVGLSSIASHASHAILSNFFE